jgi:TatD DNase family protein
VRGRESVAIVPAERLLVETDAPDLPAALHDGTPALRGADGRVLSEPAHLAHVMTAVACLRGITCAEAAKLTHHNAGQVFGRAGL